MARDVNAKAPVLAAASLIARVIAEPGVAPPTLSDDSILLVRRVDVVVDDCPGGGSGADAGVTDAAVPDATLADAGLGDAGIGDAGTCQPTILHDAVSLVVEPHVTMPADGRQFAVLYVTPARPLVESKPDPFAELGAITAPLTRIIQHEIQDPSLGTRCPGVACISYVPPSDNTTWTPPGLDDAGFGDGAVTIETVGPYELVRAHPADPSELATWLTHLGYAFAQADVDAIAPYIKRGYWIVAVRVSPAYAMDANLAPLAMTWAGTDLVLPAALGASGVAQRVTVYIAAEGRYELPGAVVSFAERTGSGPDGFLTRNDVTIAAATPDDDPHALKVPDVVVHDEIVVTQDVRVPVSRCDDEVGCCRDCSAQRTPRFDLGVLVAAIAMTLRRRRR